MAMLVLHSKKLYFSFTIIICILSLLYFLGNKDEKYKLKKNIKKLINHKAWIKETKSFNGSIPILQPVFQSVRRKIYSNEELLIALAQEAKCPACFGVEVCEEISTGHIKLTNSEPSVIQNDLMIFPGTLGTVQKVSLLVPRPDILVSFDQLVCPTSKHSQWEARCKSMLDSENPFLLSPKQFLAIQGIVSMREKLSLYPQFVVPLTCINDRVKDLFVKTFDTNNDRSLDLEERNIFHTTLTLIPHLVNLKALATIGIINTFPRVVGSCGRVLVTKGEMTPLSVMLNQPFSRRAAIAVQLLSLVQEFLENDDMWILLQPNWHLDNLHVNEKGEVFLSSLSEMYVIEKKSEEELRACNWKCVHDLRTRLTSGKNGCFNQEEASHLMYSEICVKLLSNMKQHKLNDYFERESSSRIKHRSWPGLLHDTPSHDSLKVEKALSSCADEVNIGERMDAVDDLQDLLSDIVDDSLDVDEKPNNWPDDFINRKIET